MTLSSARDRLRDAAPAPIMMTSRDSVFWGRTLWGALIATVKGEYAYVGTGFLAASIAFVDGKYAPRNRESWLPTSAAAVVVLLM